ncbi:MAG: hypothetical protein K9L75_04235 [Spirochaetia bacterium]|nr:hypothetical protein [Spirochaetia bacterium]
MAKTNMRGEGIRIRFDDDVSHKLLQLSEKSPQLLNKALESTAYGAKLEVQSGFRSKFRRRTGGFEKSIKYKQRGNRPYFKLKAPNLASVYEYNGAEIEPENAKALHFVTHDGREVFASYARIEPRPFFYPGIRKFINSGKFNDNLRKRIDEGIEEQGLKI